VENFGYHPGSLKTHILVKRETARRRISEIAGWWLVVVIVEITAAARAKITVTATHGGTSFSTLRRYSGAIAEFW
jgi:hypothetical protein